MTRVSELTAQLQMCDSKAVHFNAEVSQYNTLINTLTDLWSKRSLQPGRAIKTSKNSVDAVPLKTHLKMNFSAVLELGNMMIYNTDILWISEIVWF